MTGCAIRGRRVVPDLRDVTAALADEIEASRRPIVRIKGGDLSEVVDQAEAYLIAAEPNVFQCNQQLVYSAADEFEIANGLKAIGLRAFPFNVYSLMEVMGRACDFRRRKVKSDDWVSIDCPPKVAQAYLARINRWNVPLLRAISTTPVLLPDGRILEDDGYGSVTGILLNKQGVEFPPVPINPTKDAAMAALQRYQQVFSDFSFVSEVGRAVAVAAPLTLVARQCFRHAPGFACSATVAASGKTLLQEIAAIIAVGVEPALAKWSVKPEEADKHLDSVLLTGRPAILIDNIPKEVVVDSDRLCQAITGDRLDIRVLGASRVITVDTRGLIIFLNGNNLAFKGDITRRIARSDLDPEDERPELRPLGGPDKLKAEVRRLRPELVSGGLTLLRYYLQAGQPDPVQRIGSFEEWCELVSSALAHLGMEDATKSMLQAREDNSERAEHAALLTAWHKEFGDVFVTAKGAIERANPADPLLNAPAAPAFQEAIEAIARDRSGRLSNLKLGQWLRARKGTVVNGYRFSADRDISNTTIWRAEKL
jgi:hypothetical protein